MRRALARSLLIAIIAAASFASCGSPSEPVAREPLTPPSPPAPRSPASVSSAQEPSPTSPEIAPEDAIDTDALAGSKHTPKNGTCPAGMKHVVGTYCSKVERTCLKKEHNKPNHIDICHKFAHKTKCLTPEEPRDFCIDEYEYPNESGAHPPWMVSWYDAQATCEARGKRLCYESEWVTACEGPEHTPFPYGWDRDQTACNVDNMWVDPRLSQLYSRNPDIANTELARLDQSVPSGAMPMCVSGYGVHDMTGNFDEWVTNDHKPEDKSEWAGLKGGAWGHVRNACRPMTTSHPPDFTYYFISFRCCADPQGAPAFVAREGRKPPRVVAVERARGLHVVNPRGPSARKVQPEN